MALLEVTDLKTYFSTRMGKVRAVDGVSFSVDHGETLGIVGESGSGKSVTALSILGLMPSHSARIVNGSIRFHDTELTTLPAKHLREIRGGEIGMVFQDPMTSLNPTMTIGDQICEPLIRHRKLARKAARQEASNLLEQVQIPHASRRLDDYPHRFSGGMRQRVMIAIAIACKPKLLIADEPTTALDVTVQAGVLQLLADLRAEHNMAMIIITHDMGVIAETASQIIVMYAGQIVEAAASLELFDHPEHPYTEALLGALPQMEGAGVREGRLVAIPGRPPDMVDPPSTCRFAPRCQYAALGDECTSVGPDLRELRPGHFVRTAHPTSERRQDGKAPM